MNIQFRYADHAVDNCVVLHLFRTGNGTPRGTVKGPLSPHPSGIGSDFYLEAYLPLDVAFIAAMRLTKSCRAQMIVTGDRLLWSLAWGSLNTPAAGNEIGVSNSADERFPSVAAAA